MSALWLDDKMQMQSRTDRLYAAFTLRSRLLPAERPWLFRVGDIVRVGDEWVQILDGFLHVRRAVGSRGPVSVAAGTTVLIVSSATSTGARL